MPGEQSAATWRRQRCSLNGQLSRSARLNGDTESSVIPAAGRRVLSEVAAVLVRLPRSELRPRDSGLRERDPRAVAVAPQPGRGAGRQRRSVHRAPHGALPQQAARRAAGVNLRALRNDLCRVVSTNVRCRIGPKEPVVTQFVSIRLYILERLLHCCTQSHRDAADLGSTNSVC